MHINAQIVWFTVFQDMIEAGHKLGDAASAAEYAVTKFNEQFNSQESK